MARLRRGCCRWVGGGRRCRAYGRYVSFVRAGHKGVAAAPLLQAALVSLLSAFGASKASCVVLCGLLTMVYAAAALLYAYVAPLRVPAWSALQSVVAAVLGAVALVDALGEGGALGEASRVRATAALTVVVVVLSGVLAAHVLAIGVLELCVWEDPSVPVRRSTHGGVPMDAQAGVGDACPLPVLSPTLLSGERHERLAALIARIARDRRWPSTAYVNWWNHPRHARVPRIG